MIGVRVCEDDLADGMPVNAGRFHILGKLAGTGHKM
jgi:hypothetical protein